MRNEHTPIAAEGFPFIAVAGAITVLFALLELYKKGEATWEQSESFGPIVVSAR